MAVEYKGHRLGWKEALAPSAAAGCSIDHRRLALYKITETLCLGQ